MIWLFATLRFMAYLPGNLIANPIDTNLYICNIYDLYIYQPLRSGRKWHKVNFLVDFNRFEFRVFLLLD